MVHVTGLRSRSDSVKTSRRPQRTTAGDSQVRSSAFVSTSRLTGPSVSPFTSSSYSSSSYSFGGGGGRLQQQRSRSADGRGRASGGGGGARGHDDLYVVGYAKITTQDRPVESREGGIQYRASVAPTSPGRSSRFSQYVSSRYGATPSGAYEAFTRESSAPLLRGSLRKEGYSSLVHLPSVGEAVSYQRSSLSYGGRPSVETSVYGRGHSSRPTSLTGASSYGYSTVPLATLLGYTPSMSLARETSRRSYSRHDGRPDTNTYNRHQQLHQQQQQQQSRSWSLPHLSPGILSPSTTHATTPTGIRHTWSTQHLDKQQQQQRPTWALTQQQQQRYGSGSGGGFRRPSSREDDGDDVEERLREIHLKAHHRPIAASAAAYRSPEDHPSAVYTPARKYDLPETTLPRVEKKRVAYTSRSLQPRYDYDYDYDDDDISVRRSRRLDIGDEQTTTSKRYQAPPSLSSPPSPPVYDSIQLLHRETRRQPERLPTRSLEREKKGDVEGTSASTAAAPQFTSRLRPRSIVEGNSVRLSCAVSSAPEASVTWYHGDDAISSGGRHHITYYYGLISLEINPVNRKDSGIYTVKVANPKGSVTCSAKLDVDVLPGGGRDSDRPTFITDIQSVNTDIGDKAIFKAQIIGSPRPTVTWQKDGLDLRYDDTVQIFHDDQGFYRLQINNVKPEDSGLYSCVARNDNGMSKSIANLRVRGIPSHEFVEYESARHFATQLHEISSKEKSRPIFVTHPLAHVEVHDGDSLTLRCTVGGHPQPKVTWFKGVRELTYSQRHRLLIDKDGSFVFQIPSTMIQTDAGDYTVQATNSVGTTKYNVVVNILPRRPDTEYQTPIPTYDLEYLTHRSSGGEFIREAEHEGPARHPVPAEKIKQVEAEVSASALEISNIKQTVAEAEERVKVKVVEDLVQKPVAEIKVEAEKEIEPVVEKPAPTVEIKVEKEVEKPVEKLAEEIVPEESKPTPVVEVKEKPVEHPPVEEIKQEPTPVVEVKIEKEEKEVKVEVKTKPAEVLEEKPAPVVTVEVEREKPKAREEVMVAKAAAETVEVKHEETVTEAVEVKKPEVVEEIVQVVKEEKQDVVAVVEDEKQEAVTKVNTQAAVETVTEAKEDVTTVTEEAAGIREEVKIVKQAEVKKKAKKEVKQKVVVEEAKEKVKQVKHEDVEEAKEEVKQEVVEDAKEKVKQKVVVEEAKEKVKQVKHEDVEEAKEKVKHEVVEEAKEEVKQVVVVEEAKEEVKQEVVVEEAKEKVKQVKHEVVEEAKEEVKQEVVVVEEAKEEVKQVKHEVVGEAKEEVKQEVVVVEEAKEEVKKVKQEIVEVEIKEEVKIEEAKEEEKEISKVKAEVTEEKTAVVEKEEKEESSLEEESSEEEEEKIEEEKVIVEEVVTTAAEDKVDAAVEEKVEVKEEKKVEVVEVKAEEKIEISEKVEVKEQVESKKEETVEVAETEVKEQVITKEEKIRIVETGVEKQVEAEEEKVAVVKQVETEEEKAEEIVTAKAEALAEEGRVEETVEVVQKVKRVEEKEEAVKAKVDVAKEETVKLKTPEAKEEEEEESEEESEEEETEEEEEEESKVTVKKTVTTAAVVVETSEETTEAAETSAAAAVVTKVVKEKRTGAPGFDQPLKSELVDLGGTLTLECVVSGEPLPNVEWLRGDVVLVSTGRVVITVVERRFTLVIRSVEFSDAGKYTVRAFNEAGESRFTATVVVKGIAPSFDKPLESRLATIGAEVTLECIVSGQPQPNIEWLKDGAVITGSDRVKIISEGGRFSLVISKVENSDGGKYTVRAFNDFGESRFTATVLTKEEGEEGDVVISKTVTKTKTLVSDDSVEGTAPAFVQPLQSEVARVGGTVVLCCIVTGQPQPNVEWSKDGKVLSSTKRIKISDEDGGRYSLSISDVESSDDGKYTVRAFNNFGESRFTATLLVRELEDEDEIVVTKTVKQGKAFVQEVEGGDEGGGAVVVTSKTVKKKKTVSSSTASLEGTAPAFVEPLKSELAYVGESLTLGCVVSAEPKPNIEWLKDGAVIKESDRVKSISADSGRFSLVISEVENSDGGKYTVRAFNDFGESRFTATVLVREDDSQESESKTIRTTRTVVSSQSTDGGDEGGGAVVVTSKTVKKKKTVSSSTASLEGTAPAFVEPLKSELAYVGESLTLGCVVSAEPKPNIEWLKDGAVIKESDRVKSISADSGRFSLVISEVENSDGGKYTVRAFNDFGESRFTATVLVREDDSQESESKTIRTTRTVVSSQSTDDDFDGEGGVTIVKKRVSTSKTETSSVTEGGSGPSFDQPLKSAAVQIGETALFQCIVSGEPQPSIEWLKDGAALTAAGRIKIASDAGGRYSLSITNTEISDGGKYTARAFNSFGESRFTATLLVLEGGDDTVVTTSVKKSKTVFTSDSSTTGSGPSFEQPLKSQIAHLGGTVSLECVVAGQPQPNIEWQKDGVVVSASGRVAITSEGHGGGGGSGAKHSLSISKVEASDAGKYTVRAFNDFGESRFTATVLVKEDQESDTTTTITKTEKKTVVSSSASEVPKFVSFLKSQLSKIGGTAVLSCRVACSSPVEVTWLKGGKKVSEGGNLSISSAAEGDEYHLTIKDAQESDGGEYTVQVANDRAKLSCTASLLVTDEDVQLVEEEVVESEEEASESEEESESDSE